MSFRYDGESVSLREYDSGDVDFNLHTTHREANVSARYKAVDAGGTDYVGLTIVVTRDDGTATRDDCTTISSTTFLSLEQAEAMRDALTAALSEAIMSQAPPASTSAEGSEVSS